MKIIALALAALLLARADGFDSPPPSYLPFVATIKDNVAHKQFKAALNQDGTWTYSGEELSYDGVNTLGCIYREIAAARVPNNTAPDNSKPMSFGEMQRVICAAPVIRRCLLIIRAENGGAPSCDEDAVS